MVNSELELINERDSRALDLYETRRMMYVMNIWNPLFLPETDHGQVMDVLYSGDDKNLDSVPDCQPVIDPNYPNEANPQGM
ncbi:MAG: hypothetical protein Q8P72_00435 [Candidatus Roizmanbacteria bacterium]|nr:hypothetical protein [Candidatus Roizmanbacteria bacterium]